MSPHRGWALLVVPAAILLALQLAAALRGPLPASHASNLGAPAALVLAAQGLRSLKHVEIWAAAVGASSLDPGGVEELLRIYPFERERTLVIALEQLDGGELCYSVSARREHQHIVSLATAAGAALQTAPIKRARAERALLSEPLRRRGIQTMVVYGHSSARHAPTTRQTAAPLSADAALLIAAIVEQLEAAG
jgi:hypothetical protein